MMSAHVLVAEEGGSGKVALLERGAYEGMDACLMYVNVILPYQSDNRLYAGVILFLVLLDWSASAAVSRWRD